MQNINVNIVPDNFPQTIRYSQGDIGRQFKINVADFDIPVGATVKIQATKPSGFGFSVAGVVSDNSVTFTTTAEMTDEAGRFQAELQITSGGDVIGTANFLMIGERNPHPEGTTDGSQGTIIPELTLLVERVEKAASDILDMEVVATTLPAGSQATYSYDEDLNKATFGIPEGQAGAGAAGVVASAYSAAKTYKVGDYVLYNSNLYRCTTAITTAEAWTAAHWTQVVLADDVSDLKTDLNKVFQSDGLYTASSIFTWVTGQYHQTTGEPASSGISIRANEEIPIGISKIISGRDYYIGVCAWNGSGTFVGYWNGSAFANSISLIGEIDMNKMRYSYPNYTFKMIVRQVSLGAITTSEGDNIFVLLNYSYDIAYGLRSVNPINILPPKSDTRQNLSGGDIVFYAVDGEIVINGQATSPTVYNLIAPTLEAGKKYRLFLSKEVINNLYIQIFNNNGADTIASTQTYMDFTAPSTLSNVTARLYMPSGTVSNLTVRPSITEMQTNEILEIRDKEIEDFFELKTNKIIKADGVYTASSLFTWTAGQFHQTTGAVVSSSISIYAPEEIPIGVGKIISGSTHNVGICAWDKDGTFKGYWTGSAWNNSISMLIEVDMNKLRYSYPSYTYKMIVRRTDVQSISTSEGNDIVIQLTNDPNKRYEIESVSPLNILPPKSYTRQSLSNGDIVFYSIDGAITINGTASSPTIYNLIAPTLKPNTKYNLFLSKEPIDKLFVQLMQGGDAVASTQTFVQFTTPNDVTGITARLYMPSGTVSYLKIRPTITEVYTNEILEKKIDTVLPTTIPPMLTIIDDDGNPKFLSDLLPIIQSKHISISSAVYNSGVGQTGCMTWEQITQCYLGGAEILSHSYDHQLSYPDSETAEEIEWNYTKSKNELLSKGFYGGRYLVYSGATGDQSKSKKSAEKVFDLGIMSAGDKMNYPTTLDKYSILRYGIGSTALSDLNTLKGLVDTCLTSGGWMVWMIHTSAPEWSQTSVTNLSDVIDYAIEQGLPIVTVDHVYRKYLKNI